MQRIACSLLLVAFVAVSGARAAAGAGFDAAQLAGIKKATADFLALAKGFETSGQPPRETDPKVKALLDTIFDTAPLNSAKPFAPADIDNLNEWMFQVVQAGTVYILAGTGYADFAHFGNLDAAAQQKLQQKLTSNTVAFAPELGRYVDAQVRVMNALYETVAADMSAHPAEFKSAQSQKGFAEMRAGLVTTLTGVVTMLPTDGLSDEWRRDRLPALAEIAPTAASFLTPEQRTPLHDIALQVAQGMTDPAVKDGLTAFAQVFAG